MATERCIKHRYPGEAEARNALKRIRSRRRGQFSGGRRHRRECRYYQCDICGGWHLTSDEKPQHGR